MTDKTDDRKKWVTEKDQKKFDNITDVKVAENSLNILAFLGELETSKQYLTVNEFKRYLPLFSEANLTKYLKANGEQAFKELTEEYFRKINPYKEVTVVNNKQAKEVVAVLPPALVQAKSIEDTGISNPELDAANKLASTTLRPDLVAEGHRTYMSKLDAANKTDDAIRIFAEARMATKEIYKELDAKRDEYYKSIYGDKTGNTSKASSKSVSNELDWSEDDECFD